MTIAQLKSKNLLLFECISGSRAYGTDLPSSDTDLKGVFVLPKDQFYGLDYIPQVSSEKNDEVYYELSRFAELLYKNNPSVLEMLHTPEDCLLYCHPLFRPFLHTSFLSKLCKDSFAGFAISQIKKAKGLNKKINYPQPPERKTPLDFCFVPDKQGSIPVLTWLEKLGIAQTQCGLISLPNMRDAYGLYIDRTGKLGYSGILQKEHANEVALSSIPPGEQMTTVLSFNKDAYSQHCRDFHAYQEWVANRNEERYQNTLEHGKNYDAKNMMHTIRLLDMAEEILEQGNLIVRRPNREMLLSIRKGDFQYEELMEIADAKIARIGELFLGSQLPETPDKQVIERLMLEVRDGFYETL